MKSQVLKFVIGKPEDIAKAEALRRNPIPNSLKGVIEVPRKSTVKSVSINTSENSRRGVKR